VDYYAKELNKLLNITENFDVLTFVVNNDIKNITHTISNIWLFCVSFNPFDGNGDLLPYEGIDDGSGDLALIHMIINTQEIVEIIPITVK